MYRYYKISHEWALKLGEAESAPQHPDGMHLVIPSIAPKLIALLREEIPGSNPLPEDAFNTIGAIGLSVAEAQASAKGELRHDGISSPDIDFSPEIEQQSVHDLQSDLEQQSDLNDSVITDGSDPDVLESDY